MITSHGLMGKAVIHWGKVQEMDWTTTKCLDQVPMTQMESKEKGKLHLEKTKN